MTKEWDAREGKWDTHDHTLPNGDPDDCHLNGTVLEGETDAERNERINREFTEFYGRADIPEPTHYTVHVTLEADLPTVPHTFDTWDEAEAHAQFVTTLLASTAEPQPAHATHDAQGSTYTTAGHHELYGEWSVALTVRD